MDLPSWRLNDELSIVKWLLYCIYELTEHTISGKSVLNSCTSKVPNLWFLISSSSMDIRKQANASISVRSRYLQHDHQQKLN